jgi:hypothetical protein
LLKKVFVGYLSLIKNSRIGSIIYRLATWILLLFRKKVIFAAAVYWTFSNTLKALFQVVSGGQTLAQAWAIFLSEAWTKFLGAAPQLLQGLKQIQQGEIGAGVLSLWTAAASLYMMLFLWKLFRGKFQKVEIDEVEQGLILVVWVLASALVHGPELLINISIQLENILNTVSNIMPTNNQVNNTSQINESMNLSNSTN